MMVNSVKIDTFGLRRFGWCSGSNFRVIVWLNFNFGTGAINNRSLPQIFTDLFSDPDTCLRRLNRHAPYIRFKNKDYFRHHLLLICCLTSGLAKYSRVFLSTSGLPKSFLSSHAVFSHAAPRTPLISVSHFPV